VNVLMFEPRSVSLGHWPPREQGAQGDVRERNRVVRPFPLKIEVALPGGREVDDKAEGMGERMGPCKGAC